MFEEKIKIKSTMVDHNQFLNLQSMSEICEYLGMEDLKVINLPYKEMLDNNLVWIVSKSSFIINRLPKFDEEIYISTHAKDHSKLIFPRSYKIEDINHNVLIEAEGRWALLDMKTRKVIILVKT